MMMHRVWGCCWSQVYARDMVDDGVMLVMIFEEGSLMLKREVEQDVLC